MPALPAWLNAHLQDTGALVGRAARIRQCTGCGHRVLEGIDADRCGLLAVCDPTEIDTRGELLALALGLRTYTLTRSTNSRGLIWQLDPRHPAAIEAGQRTPLVAAHRCGIAIPPGAATHLPKWTHPRTTDQPDF